MSRVLRLTAVAFGFAFGLLGAAEAKYSLCNKTSYVLSAAIAYVDGDRLATRGWWRLNPGQCKVVLTESTDPGRYFVYAEGIQGHAGPLRSWSGDTPLCVEPEGFFNLRNQEVCKDDPSRQRDFFTVDVTEAAKGNWRTDFAEAENYSVFSAEVAGIQRLLIDVGEFSGRIDGSLGKNTQQALANYRQKKSLGDGAVIDDDTIAALVEDANAREAKLGFYFCNKADAPVWSAFAEPEEETYRSRGWWLIEAGDCVKVLKGELKSDHYYVYGLIDADAAEKRLVGGDREFCVNAIKFNALNDVSCEDQELDSAIFRRVEIGSANSATYEFRVDAFVGPPAQPASE
ncbi:MAG: DUF1036 domain-containing protein [Alphaproteobacteria bacterium]|nr:DUF1036 domain-containing protein [Alphaproteobacteria bacterium]